ncbi:hypothetical protein [Bradyrhizobium manausense]|uniref:Uncharacterized protein n=1 Tax=Bradyrhizobium manausense TaxID=989370 RepID=A0A0R3E7G0_9BRAD|nr:hypothetical protein [Bradyrhizobium manausense]KRQ15836.1 hypothetical protein AOQ71_07645 [Bradyrhizobium manausense]
MDRFVECANIDHFLNILTSQDISDRNRETISKLMIAEEDKLGRNLEYLEFAEKRASKCRDRLNYLRRLRDAFADGTEDRLRAEKVLANFQVTHDLVEEFCCRLRVMVSSSPL